jgi:hypothetical protein
MSTIYLTSDAGDVFYDASADKCYHKAAANPVCQPPDTSLGAGDATGVAAVTFELDDSGVSGGTNHRTWTACQMCVALHVSGNQAEVECLANGTKYTLFTAPSAGVLRCWISDWGGGTGGNDKIYVNDGLFSTGQMVTNLGYRPSGPLASGDVVKVELNDMNVGTTSIVSGIFCPFVYP